VNGTADLPVVEPRVGLQRPRLALLRERIVESVIALCGVSAVLLVGSIFLFVLIEALPILWSPNFSVRAFLFSIEWYPTSATDVRYGVAAMIFGTLAVTALSMLIAVPLGVAAAIYLSEFAGARARETLKVIIEFLAAIPSVVWGFIGLTIMNRLIIALFDAPVGLNVLNAGLLLALMSLPIVTSLAEDALKGVPDSYREAGLAMGATRWQLAYRVLVPAARNGLLAAALLGAGRALGETMAVLMATGHAVAIPHALTDPVRTLTANIAAEMGEVSRGSEHFHVLFLIGVLLFVITFAVNMAADIAVRGVRRRR
jgi:phosphate transport system permease protein